MLIYFLKTLLNLYDIIVSYVFFFRCIVSEPKIIYESSETILHCMIFSRSFFDSAPPKEKQLVEKWSVG